VHLAILDHDSILYIITHESKQALRMARRWERVCPCIPRRWKGPPRVPAEEEIERIIARGLPVSAPNTIVDPKALRRELATVRARNYAVDDEESEIGLRAIAAPVRVYSGTWSRRSALPARCTAWRGKRCSAGCASWSRRPTRFRSDSAGSLRAGPGRRAEQQAAEFFGRAGRARRMKSRYDGLQTMNGGGGWEEA